MVKVNIILKILNLALHGLETSVMHNLWYKHCYELCYWFRLMHHTPCSLLPHSLQVKGFSPIWVRICIFRSLLCEFPAPHSLQLNGFSPVCVRKWIFKLLVCENPTPHSWQVNGFSPVCNRICNFRLEPLVNPIPHSWQLNGFSPVCVHICNFSLLSS